MPVIGKDAGQPPKSRPIRTKVTPVSNSTDYFSNSASWKAGNIKSTGGK